MTDLNHVPFCDVFQPNFPLKNSFFVQFFPFQSVILSLGLLTHVVGANGLPLQNSMDIRLVFFEHL